MFDYGTTFRNVRPAREPGRMKGATQGVSYPSPFFDLAHTYLPPTIKQMFRWCRYYYLTNPLISATVNKMSEYPITDIVLDTDNKGLKEHWEHFLEDELNIRSVLLDIGLYYMCYGNAIVSLYHPFVKWLKCKHCGSWVLAKDAKYRFRSWRFDMTCGKCGHIGEAGVKDQQLKTSNGSRLIIWNPEDIDINHNPITGKTTYFYRIPKQTRNEILIGKRETIENIPQVFIDAAKKSEQVTLVPDNVFHLRRPSLLTAPRDRGWGTPLLLPVLKDVFYLQIMKKAQEAILIERIVPLTVLFPQQSTGTSDPYTSVNLVDWKNHVAKEIQRWRLDRNYIPILPLPIGQQVVGGDGRALLLSNEIKVWSDQIIAGMGVPNEFVYGGLQWSGSNVSLRMLENQFMRYLSSLRRFLEHFLIKRMSLHMGWTSVGVRFKPFKMADDLQRKAYLFQLNQSGKLSDTTLLQDSDFSPEEEDELMKKEVKRRLEAVKEQQLAEAEIAGEAQVVQAKYQAKANATMQMESEQAMQGQLGAAPGEPAEGVGSPAMASMAPQQGQPMGGQPMGGQAPGGPDPMAMIVQRLKAAHPEAQRAIIDRISQRNPQVAAHIRSMLSSGTEGSSSASKPLPAQLPPRRGPGSAMI